MKKYTVQVLILVAVIGFFTYAYINKKPVDRIKSNELTELQKIENNANSDYEGEMASKSSNATSTIEATSTAQVLGTAIESNPPQTIKPKPQAITNKEAEKLKNELEKQKIDSENTKAQYEQIQKVLEAKAKSDLEQQKLEEVKRLLDIEKALVAKKQAEEAEIREKVAQEAAYLKQQIAEKQALLERMNTECTIPINNLKQQVIDVKSKYFSDLDALNKTTGITTFHYNNMSTSLLNAANTKIQDLNNQISQKALQCKIKFGN